MIWFFFYTRVSKSRTVVLLFNKFMVLETISESFMHSCCLVHTSSLSLEDVFDEVIVVDMLDSRDSAHLFWLGRPDLGVTFTKLHCWTLTQYTKCVFLDADTLVSRPSFSVITRSIPHSSSAETRL